MAYTPEYTTDDLQDIVVDGVAKFGIVVAGFAGLIALVGLGIWAYGKFR